MKPDAAETFWQRYHVNLPVSPKLRSRELVGLIWGRNPSRLAPAVKPRGEEDWQHRAEREAVGRRHARQRRTEGPAGKKMVTPAAKREAVAHLRSAFDMSERRACRTIGCVPGPGWR